MFIIFFFAYFSFVYRPSRSNYLASKTLPRAKCVSGKVDPRVFSSTPSKFLSYSERCPYFIVVGSRSRREPRNEGRKGLELAQKKTITPAFHHCPITPITATPPPFISPNLSLRIFANQTLTFPLHHLSPPKL